MRLRLILMLLTISLLASCQAQKLARYSHDFQLSKTNFVDTIAIELERNLVFVPVSIEGKNYRFLLDTGAGQPVVFEDTPMAQGIQAGFIIAHDAVGKSDTVRQVILPPIQLGELTLTGCQATVQHRAVKRRNIDGILGFSIVNRGPCMKIDTRNRHLILTDRQNFFDHEPGYELKYKLNFHVPNIEVKPFGKHRENTLFDTGSQQFFAMNKAHFDKATSNTNRQPVGLIVEGRSQGRYAIGHSGAEAIGEVVFIELRDMKLGNMTFSHLHTQTTQGGSHMGASLLKLGTVSFNPHRKRMRFHPYEEGDTCMVNNEQMEIAFVSDNGLPAVGLVWEGGVPYKQGFREGDIITEIDHRPVTSLTQFAVWAYEPGREYVFTVRTRQGQQKEVHWVRLQKNTK